MAYSWGQPSAYYFHYQQHTKPLLTVADANSFVQEIVLKLQVRSLVGVDSDVNATPHENTKANEWFAVAEKWPW